MKATKFPQANKNLSKPDSMTDEECSSLWIFTDGKQCISCWKLNWKQRFSALIFGKVWLSVLSGQTQPPVWLDCTKSVFINVEYQKNREKIEEYRKRSEGRKILSWLVSGMEWVNEHCIKEEA